ncbi:hypothetical protein O6H91_20G056000 [Diphasiastrum complanatum]|uniref:Uncharacterized protein n=1 Tax=Diphasiastrum complanatum TaxID=34168 RepID=A0ACC2AQI9_DIPCM|nr:hypothetical protein O6H91_20G056000 [Diphasiastrum complanatum]
MRGWFCLCCASPRRAEVVTGSFGARMDNQQVRDPVLLQPGPYADVDASLRAMAGAAEGFGHAAIGGVHGHVYHVTSLADKGDGTLREACRQQEPLWIIFELSGTIMLSSPIRVSSYKTIDGRGHKVKLSGNGLQLRECEHIIICNLEFEGGRGHDVDGIQLKPKTRNVWIDRCTLSDYDDGLIDITRQSTNVTISRCHFHHHDKTMLISADPKHVDDRCIQVTIHHCFFDGTRQRHPRLRFGKVHLYNNYTRNWGIYAVCASVEAQILSQSNIYQAGSKKTAFEYYTEKAADKEETASGSLRSEGDLFLNGAQGKPCNPFGVFAPQEFYPTWTLEPASEALLHKIQLIAGWQKLQLPPDL